MTGAVCLGPLKDRSQVRGVYSYSERDRIADTSAAYPAAFPIGLMPTNVNDTGLVVQTTTLSAWRADGTPVTKAQLGDPGPSPATATCCWGCRPNPSRPGTATTPPVAADP